MGSKKEFEDIVTGERVTLGAFKRDGLRCRSDIEYKRLEIPVIDFANFFCPWYYINDGKSSKEVDYGFAKIHEEARAMRIKDAELINLDADRKKKIDEYQDYLTANNPKEPIILAFDLNAGKYFIMDGNKTSCTLYRIFLASNEDKKIPVILMKAPNLDNILCDFCIINRK